MRREKGKRQINCLSRKKSGRTGNNREGKFNSLRLRARDGSSPGRHAIKSTDGVCVGERERERELQKNQEQLNAAAVEDIF